jgi:hypothetical protein
LPRLRTFCLTTTLALVLGSLAGCGSPPTPAANPTASPVPLRVADCASTALPSVRVNPARPDLPIQQPAMDCQPPFDVVADFTYYDNGRDPAAACVNAKASPNHRPCQLPLWTEPRFRSGMATPASTWRPTEGEILKVECQVVADDIPDVGSLRDAYGNRSNVWNKVIDPRIPRGFGWANDLWTGDGGWRGVACK